MNHCWRVFKAPVSSCVCPGLFAREVLRPCDMNKTQKMPQTTDSGLDQWRSCSLVVLAEVLGLSTWVFWSLICGGSAVWVKTLCSPKPYFQWKIEEGNGLQAWRWTLSLLVLSFNRIKLLIISWTGLRPYLNLSWTAAEIRELWLLLCSPRSQQHATILKENFVLL